MSRAVYAREAIVTYRRLDVPDGEGSVVGVRVCSSKDVESIAQRWIGGSTIERFVVFALDARMRVVAAAQVGQGGTAECPVSASEIGRFLLLSGAHAFVAAHNHPSGDATPSPQDIAITKRLADLGTLIGAQLLDHVIVVDRGRGFSFLDANMLPRT